jgi:high-affinity iron transporter
MLEAFIIVLREGFEAFLIVAIIFAYLRKTGQSWLLVSVYAAILAAVCSSLALGYLIKQGINQSFWEGVFGVIAIVFVGTLVIHMRRVGPHLMQRMNARLDSVSVDRPRFLAYLGVFLFTALMITREGMETALMLTQVRGRYLTGALLGLAGATLLAIAWARFGHLINMKRFFQVTSIFLLLFILQIALYSFHEFAEAGVFGARSDSWHAATEVWSPEGLYGKWISLAIVALSSFWLLVALVGDRLRRLEPMATPVPK